MPAVQEQINICQAAGLLFMRQAAAEHGAGVLQ